MMDPTIGQVRRRSRPVLPLNASWRADAGPAVGRAEPITPFLHLWEVVKWGCCLTQI